MIFWLERENKSYCKISYLLVFLSRLFYFSSHRIDWRHHPGEIEGFLIFIFRLCFPALHSGLELQVASGRFRFCLAWPTATIVSCSSLKPPALRCWNERYLRSQPPYRILGVDFQYFMPQRVNRQLDPESRNAACHAESSCLYRVI